MHRRQGQLDAHAVTVPEPPQEFRFPDLPTRTGAALLTADGVSVDGRLPEATSLGLSHRGRLLVTGRTRCARRPSSGRASTPARVAAETTAREFQQRYGTDITDPKANPDDVRAALARAEVEHAGAALASQNAQAESGGRGGEAVEFTLAEQVVGG
ncbi:hypothetical protein [Clavibacter zhangzhiyongii]|uniref:hypothetical protein n=1 Tax=Clavibacter zhangzhiyongii TaxID=2768071 RepID=UPI001FD32BBD|nr:hypothetical protein [Clavibacter zhangzhiyongii]